MQLCLISTVTREPVRGPHQHDMDEGFVQGGVEVAESKDAGSLAERLGERAAERERNILHGVMVVDPRVTLRVHLDVQQPMRRDLLQAMPKPSWECTVSGLQAGISD